MQKVEPCKNLICIAALPDGLRNCTRWSLEFLPVKKKKSPEFYPSYLVPVLQQFLCFFSKSLPASVTSRCGAQNQSLVRFCQHYDSWLQQLMFMSVNANMILNKSYHLALPHSRKSLRCQTQTSYDLSEKKKQFWGALNEHLSAMVIYKPWFLHL